MSKLTALLVQDIFGAAPRARLSGVDYFELDERDYRRFQALAPGNPGLAKALGDCLTLERQRGNLYLVPVSSVDRAKLETATLA